MALVDLRLAEPRSADSDGTLAQQYDSMRAWVDLELELAGDDRLWTGGFQFADWLDPTTAHADPFDQRTDPDLLATAAMIHSVDLLTNAAHLLGRGDDEERCTRFRARHTPPFAHTSTSPRAPRIRRADHVTRSRSPTACSKRSSGHAQARDCASWS